MSGMSVLSEILNELRADRVGQKTRNYIQRELTAALLLDPIGPATFVNEFIEQGSTCAPTSDGPLGTREGGSLDRKVHFTGPSIMLNRVIFCLNNATKYVLSNIKSLETGINSDTSDSVSLASRDSELRGYMCRNLLILVNLNRGKAAEGIFSALSKTTM